MIQALEKFGKLRRRLNLSFTQSLKPLGIGPKQAILLHYLSSHGTSSPTGLSRATVTDPAAVNRAVAVLLKRTLVRREEHATDQRRWQLSLTPKGQNLAGRVEGLYASVSRKLVDPLSPAEKKVFLRLLDKILDSFTAPPDSQKPKEE